MSAKSKFRRIIANPRVLIVIAAVLISVWSTGIPFSLGMEGVAIRGVEKGSAAYDAGIKVAEGDASFTSKEVIVSIDNKNVKAIEDYAAAVSGIEINQSILVETNKAFYRLTAKPQVIIRTLPELEGREIVVNATTNENLNYIDTNGKKTKIVSSDYYLIKNNLGKKIKLDDLITKSD